MRELPVKYSGPTIISIGKSETTDKGEFLLHVIHPVVISFSLHFFIPATTYGVYPEAEIPITISLFVRLYFFKSIHA